MNKIYRNSKYFLRSLFVYIKDRCLFRKPISIIMLHSVGENSEFFTVQTEDFEKYMNYLKNGNYNVISISDLKMLMVERKKIPRKTVVITFDDGYEDNYKNAWPILRKLNFPATIFLTTGWVGDKNHKSKRGVKIPMLNWQEIKEMHSSGLIDFEPHSVNHPRLSSLSLEDIKKEMFNSKIEIEKKLDKKCKFFAYPFGDFDENVESVAGDIFDLTVTVQSGFVKEGDKLSSLKRNSIDSLTGLDTFKLKV